MGMLFEGEKFSDIRDVRIKQYTREQKDKLKIARDFNTGLVIYFEGIKRYAIRNMGKLPTASKGIEDTILKNDSDMEDEIKALWSKYMKEAAFAGYQDVLADTNMSSVQGLDIDDWAIQYIRQNGLNKSKLIIGVMKEQLRKVIEQAMRDGVDIKGMQQALEQGFGLVKSHAFTVAMTETGSAMNGSYSETIERLQVSSVWVSALMETSRLAHVEADGQKKVAGGYTVDGEMLKYPCDSNGSAGNVINCHCHEAVVD